MNSIDSSELGARLRAATDARVLVVGSLNVDVILYADGEPADDQVAVVRSELRAPGGHAGNCAAALAALGCRVSLLASVGTDVDGDFLVEDLRARGVNTAFIYRDADAVTGRAYIPVFGTHHYMLLSRGANEALGASHVRAALDEGCDGVMLFDPSREALLEVVRALSTPRPRPLLCWTPGGVSARDPIAADVVPHCDVVLLNRAEHRFMSQLVPDLDDGESGPEIVVTLGKDGSTARSGGRWWKAAGRPAEEVDPTGAGDAFAASYLLGLLAGVPIEARLALANVAGALAVTAPGARGRLATLAEVLDGLADVRHDRGSARGSSLGR